MNRKRISIAVAQALSAGVAVGLAAPWAFAQQPASPVVSEVAQAVTPAPIQRIEKIEVTGSRIPSLTLTSESPVNVITAEDIRWTGSTSTSDILNQLPQAAPYLSAVNTGARTNVNLYGDFVGSAGLLVGARDASGVRVGAGVSTGRVANG